MADMAGEQHVVQESSEPRSTFAQPTGLQQRPVLPANGHTLPGVDELEQALNRRPGTPPMAASTSENQPDPEPLVPFDSALSRRVVRTSPLIDALPTPLVESMRYLTGRFLLGEHEDFPHRLAVTSALHGEGVTTVSRTLAAVAAHDFDVDVCWVDLSWPTTRWVNDRKPRPGLVDVVTGGATLDEALQVTDDPRVTMLGSGTVPQQQRDALSRSSVVGAILDQLSERFSTVIMDTPPVLGGSLGLGQLKYAESYLLVVRQGVTAAPQIRAATDELRTIPALGVVLNHYHSSIPKRLVHFFVS
jgi:Mrp family chromosome partitioning ATPase